MTYLSQLTPAETLILTKGKVTQSELLKITLIDLLFKKVLKIIEVERQPHISQDIRLYKYIGIGENYHNNKSENHERLFLSTFVHDESFEILFINLVKIGYQKSKTFSVIKNDLIKTTNLKNCFSQNFFQRIFNRFSFTDNGRYLQSKVQNEIQSLENEYYNIKNIENQKVVELIKIIGANIFLLSNIDYELLNQFDKDLASEINNNKYTDSLSGCSGCGFDDFSISFDSGCGGESGGGGGSGCSGCGGCGGCGD